MARSTRFLTGLISSYAAIFVNIAYTLGSIPLALHYLNKEEFGMWILVTQITGYLTLLELGLSASVSRFLADHKDDPSDNNYGSVIKTGTCVFSIQGLVVSVCGVALAFTSAGFLNIPLALQPTFAILLSAQATLAGIHIATRTVGSILWCHQRHDVIGIAGMLNLILTFFTLWLGFFLGWKFYGFIAASLIGFLVSQGVSIYAAHRYGYYPKAENKGRFDKNIFRQLFQYGSGLFVMNIGTQLASASQVVIISRFMGLEAASTWSITTKVASLSQTLVARISESSAPALAEMIVRNEKIRLKQRFQDVCVISNIMALAAAAGITFLNQPFLEIWTSSRVSWLPINNWLLGVLVFVTTISRNHVNILTLEKNINGLKHICLLEGIAFIVSASLGVKFFGFPGLLVAAIACNTFVTLYYSLSKSRHYLPDAKSLFEWDYLRHLGILSIIALLFGAQQFFHVQNHSQISSILIPLLFLLVIVAPLLWTMGLNKQTRHEIHSILRSKLRF